MKTMFRQTTLIAALCVGAGLQLTAHADTVLDTGTPAGSAFPLTFDGADFYAAQFTVGDGQSIDAVQAYLHGGALTNVGDTFSFALYAADGVNQLPGTLQASWQASYQADGWNGLSNLASGPLSAGPLAAGNYWLALEVGAADTASGLDLPVNAAGGLSPAQAFAFAVGGNYQSMTGYNFGLQVSTVPVPPALVMFAPALLGLIRARRG